MSDSHSLRPSFHLYPLRAELDDHQGDVSFGADVEEVVEMEHAMPRDAIVGTDRVVYDDITGSGALPARPLPSPKGMTAANRAVHDLTHLPYEPSCEICVSCRRPNSHHRTVSKSERSVPLLVGDYAFPKHSDDVEPLTVLVVRVYPYKLFMTCVVPCKGRDPLVVDRLVRFIKECGLTQFTFRSDREPAIMAMMDEACSLSGRNGKRDMAISESEAIAHTQLVEGDKVIDDPDVADEPHVENGPEISSTHTAAPELTHPGESQTNGLAERSVGIFEDHFRTIKAALEIKLKQRLPSAHPITAWIVEHTAWLLNKFHLGADARTAYGRLHGREGRERICEFGEVVMWFVPKKMRAKLDQRWRYGVFLGRALSSDQNFIGLKSGDVICARAMVRVVPNVRWSADRISMVKVLPLTFKSNALDHIEESTEPHSHPEPNADAEEVAHQSRRVKVMDADIKRFGFTNSCQRCQYLRQGRLVLAKGVRHNEDCRERIYDALRQAGDDKVKRADLADSGRTVTRAKKRQQDPPEPPPTVVEELAEPIVDVEDTMVDDTPNVYEPPDAMDDTTEFYKEVDWDEEELADAEDGDAMISMVDVLQTLGISAGDATAYAVKVIKSRTTQPSSFGPKYQPTFFELYGHGNIVEASHGQRRDLNLNGLHALDLRTSKPNGEPWDFSNATDRKLAKSLINELKPTWVIGSPPCTFSAHGIKV